MQFHLIISLRHRGQIHLSVVSIIHTKCEYGQQESKLISANWIISPGIFGSRHHCGHMESLFFLFIEFLLKNCANDSLVASIRLCSYCFSVHARSFIVLLLLRDCMYSGLFFPQYCFFSTSCQKSNPTAFPVTVGTWMEVHISGRPSWMLFLLDLGSSTILPITGTTEQLTYYIMPLFKNL